MAATFLPRTNLLPVALRQPNPPPFLAARNRDEGWQQDLAYLAKELPRLHLNAFHTMRPDEFQGYVQEVRAGIPTLSDNEIIVRLMALVARTGDGHTTLNFTSLYQGEEPWRIFPLRLMWLQDQWYVTGADGSNAHLLGSRLVAIEEVPADEAYNRIRPIIAADNEMQRRNTGATLLVTADVLAALDIIEAVDHAQFTFMLLDGQSIDLVIESAAPQMVQLQGLQTPSAQIPLAQRNPERWYWYETLPQANMLYFQYDVCDEMEDLPFAEFTTSLFKAVDDEALTRIVVDLRANGGGNSAVLRPFLQELAARPEVEVVVLIGRRTFSSALMNAIELDQQAGALLVGEPTGGRPNHYGEVGSFQLPNSQLQVGYSTKHFRMLPDADPPSLEPDIAAPPTIESLLSGEDAALNVALAR